ncbi:hypothetical protein F53441_7996 [Fusarium austroafricanum]|uniref:Uncharacterized protein n=1 Tax=Fusarium austroafricanum TaxID=2364996 RepID=A0A8H4NUW3_9HYPO|nr:hypothetical protein F53441_7996 [Fusarium austroafricanum]
MGRLGFLDLPREVQLPIIEYALSSLIVPVIQPNCIDQHQPNNAYLEYGTLNIRLTCRAMNQLVKTIRAVDAPDYSKERHTFCINFKKDILRIFKGQIPVYMDKHGEVLPNPAQHVLSVYNYEIPYDRHNRLTVAVPRPIPRQMGPTPQRLQSTGADYFISKGIPVDTGEKWQINPCFYGKEPSEFNQERPHYYFCSPAYQILSPLDPYEIKYKANTSLPDSDIGIGIIGARIPYVGFYGHDRGERSMGGNWSKFVYNKDTEEVFFAPMYGGDLEPSVKIPCGLRGKKKVWQDHHPQFVAHVTLIRNGDDMPFMKGNLSWMPVWDKARIRSSHPWSENLTDERIECLYNEDIAHLWALHEVREEAN